MRAGALILLVGFTAQAVAESQSKESEFLHFVHSGGLSAREKVAVTVSSDGAVNVKVEQSSPGPIDYGTRLSQEEFAALRAIVRMTDFFAQPEKQTEPVPTDTGVTEITVSEADRRRSLRFAYRKELEPIGEFLWMIVTQATALDALQRGDTYTTLSAVSRTAAGAKVLQPTVLKAPLIEYLRQPKPERADWAAAALASITTPQEFAGFIATEGIEVAAEKRMLPSFHDFKEHNLALAPVYLDYVKRKFPSVQDYGREGDALGSALASSLADLRYEPALPYFLRLFDESAERYPRGPVTHLINFGAPAVRVLTSRLETGDEAHRLVAADLLATAASLGRQRLFNSLDDGERARLRELYQQTVLPALAVLAEKDASKEVRAKAESAILQIGAQLRTEPSGPVIKLTLTPDLLLTRTLLDGEIDKTIVWNLFRDGEQILALVAGADTEYRHRERLPGSYSAFVTVVEEDDTKRVVSNVAFCEVR